MKTVLLIPWIAACSIDTLAICLWNKLNVEKCQPVAQMKILFRPLNSHRIGRLDKHIVAILSAMYRQSWMETFGQL